MALVNQTVNKFLKIIAKPIGNFDVSGKQQGDSMSA